MLQYDLRSSFIAVAHHLSTCSPPCPSENRTLTDPQQVHRRGGRAGEAYSGREKHTQMCNLKVPKGCPSQCLSSTVRNVHIHRLIIARAP